MSYIPTAQEFLKSKGLHQADVEEIIEFTKLHVDLALKTKVKSMIDESKEDSSYSISELDSFTPYDLNIIK